MKKYLKNKNKYIKKGYDVINEVLEISSNGSFYARCVLSKGYENVIINYEK